MKMGERKFEFFVLVNWRNGKVKATKKQPRKCTPWDIPIKVQLNILTPDMKPEYLLAKGEIVITESKLGQMVIEALDDEPENN